jgi:succinate-acetate transporter protein
MTAGRLMAFNPRANLPNTRGMVLRGWGIYTYLMSLSCVPTRNQMQHPRLKMKSSTLDWRGEKNGVPISF